MLKHFEKIVHARQRNGSTRTRDLICRKVAVIIFVAGSGVVEAHAAAGDLYVSSFNSGTIVKVTRDRTSSTFANMLVRPCGLAFDRAGNLFVAASDIEAPSGLALERPTGIPLNISTRMQILTGDNVLIAGFILIGSDQKKVIIRGIGPSLSAAGIVGPLEDPILELHDSKGVTIAENDDWRQTQESEIVATGIPPSDDRESGIVMTLSPGAYTAVERGNADRSGIGLVEVYDLEQGTHSSLANISTRGIVETGSDVMVGGFIIGAGNGARVILRALGPSLSAAGISGALADPTLELHDGNGALVMGNDNWRESQESEIQNTAIAPSNDLESAIVATLPPGSYTAVVAGAAGGQGIGLVELYNLP